MLVPASAAATLANDQRLPGSGQVTEDDACICIENNRARRDRDDKILAITPGHLRRSASESVLRFEFLILSERRQRVKRVPDLKNDIAALAAVAAIGAAVCDKFFAMEMHHAIAAFA